MKKKLSMSLQLLSGSNMFKMKSILRKSTNCKTQVRFRLTFPNYLRMKVIKRTMAL
jgi:hypothetical protein